MVFTHEILVDEDESMSRATGVLVQTAADPGLLIGDGVTIKVMGRRGEGVRALTGGYPGVDNDEAGVVARGSVIKRVTHAVQFGADRGRAVEVRRAEGIAAPRVCGKLFLN